MISEDEVVRSYFRELVIKHGLGNELITAAPVGKGGVRQEGVLEFKVVPPEWFRLPSKEYAIAKGKEVIMECVFKNAKAHVFTPSPFKGSIRLREVLELSLNTISERSVFYGSLNAVMRHLGIIERTVHCRGDVPLKCGKALAERIIDEYGDVPVLLVGYQPAFANALSKAMSRLHVTDMDPGNVGKRIGRTVVVDHKANEDLIDEVELVLITGSSIINSTFWGIWRKTREKGKDIIIYGVSGAGAAKIFNIKRHCPYAT